MASINIDGSRAKMVEREANMVQMENGCICCTLREDLLIEIKQLALEQKFDYLLIESTGVSEPMPVAETFTFGELEEHDHDEDGECVEDEKEPEKGIKVLSDIAKLDCMVTVMDAKQFFDYLQDDADIFEKWGEVEEIAEEDQGTSVCTLLIEQLEFANVILLNKTDLVSEEELKRVTAIVEKLNPGAKVLKTQYSKVDPSEVLNTSMFDFEEAQYHAGWLKEIRGEHVPESAEYGISSFVYRSRRPMSSARFEAFLCGDVMKENNVIRAKGSMWFDCADGMITAFDKAGASIEVNAETIWFVEMQQNEPEMWASMEPQFQQAVLADFEGENGDKRQEMVFIGQNMNEEVIRSHIDACLLTDAELEGDWKNVPNPFEFEFQEDEEMQEESVDAQ